jgi:hypothetical protein
MRILAHTLSNTFLHVIQQTLSQTMNNNNNNAFALSPRKRAKHEAASEPAVELQCDGDPAAVHPAGAGAPADHRWRRCVSRLRVLLSTQHDRVVVGSAGPSSSGDGDGVECTGVERDSSEWGAVVLELELRNQHLAQRVRDLEDEVGGRRMEVNARFFARLFVVLLLFTVALPSSPDSNQSAESASDRETISGPVGLSRAVCPRVGGTYSAVSSRW